MQCLRRLHRCAKNVSHQYVQRCIKRKAAVVNSIIYRYNHNSSNDFEDDEEEESERERYMQMSHDYLGTATTGHRVYVLQPYIKWGQNKRRDTTPELQLAEAVALINTLQNWTVVQKKCIALQTMNKKKLLGEGNLQSLKEDIHKSHATAIFVSANILKFIQLAELQKILRVPVYDRYSIVIHIFRQHAKTPEARLQVALAEIPYMRKKMKELDSGRGGHINLIDIRKRLLECREKKLKNALKKLEEHRKLIRSNRKSYGFPSIAVVGYTNAGKTSLIKALTGDASLVPENKLFATLDTTVHEGVLPSRLKVLYVDTIGFIQDVPETLIEPFVVTLEDAIIADIIIHVYDISHPDVQVQIEHVRKTIAPMIDKDKVVIDVANKCDLVEFPLLPNDAIAVSSTELIGIDALRMEIEEKILATTGLIRKRVRVVSGSTTASWLYKEATVTDATPDPDDPQYLILDILMSANAFYKFKKYLKE